MTDKVTPRLFDRKDDKDPSPHYSDWPLESAVQSGQSGLIFLSSSCIWAIGPKWSRLLS